MRAGGGIRTPTLFRATGPKPAASPGFRHARMWGAVHGKVSHPPSTLTRKATHSFLGGVMTRPKEEFETVKTLIAQGYNDCEIERLTGINRRTVLDWRWGRGQATDRPSKILGCDCAHDFRFLPADAYSYLLGMYLGDGFLSDHGRGVFRLRIVSDARYPGIIDECCNAIEAVMPRQRAYRQARKDGCVEMSMYSKHWPCLFPQHGPGRKHERPIELQTWQQNSSKPPLRVLFEVSSIATGAVSSLTTEVFGAFAITFRTFRRT